MSASAGQRAEPASIARALVFIGFMGAGKSSAARVAAAALGTEARDSDRLLEADLGHSIEAEFERNGEAGFRAREEALVCSLLEQARAGDVISLGGGAVMSERVQRALRPHLTVLMDADVELAWSRAGRRRRPLARDESTFRALHAERRVLYDRLADAFLPCGEDRELVVGTLPSLAVLARAPAGTRLLWATSASGDYPVFLGEGILEAGVWPALGPGSRGVCITDANVGPLHAARVRDPIATITLAPGEGHKTLAQAEAVWREMARAGVTRSDHVIALGGGVVGDLAGFCAATYQRGIEIVQLPSTLVAAVDSAYGGKTGIDLPEAKNYVGAYHQPAAVIVDFELLGTLPGREAAAGYVEVLKTALIAGGPLWERVAAGEDPDPDMIRDCVRTKLAIVSADERDGGLRQVLNLGHTVGHAIETATGYERYRHGEAVGLGLLAALRLSGQDELREQVGALLAARGLPRVLEHADPADVLSATARDKKRTGSGVALVLLDGPGAVRHGCILDNGELATAVSELATGAR